MVLTDGFLDAVGPAGERYGEDRLTAALSAAPADPSGLVKRLCDEATAFTGHVPQADDLTVLAVTPARVPPAS